MIQPGDPAPLFVARTTGGEDWWLSSAAGTHTVLTCADGQVTVGWPDPAHVLLDGDGAIEARYGAGTTVLDPGLRVLDAMPTPDPDRIAEALACDDDRPPPVLIVPRLLEPELCRALIAEYERIGGTDSGFVRDDASGRTVAVVDHSHKRRADVVLSPGPVRASVKERIERRLVPEIRRAFQFTPTRVERYLVACYDAADGGHFRPHRDNTTKGTAHRRFAMTINLNADYEGGDLRFPEFGRRTLRAPVGGAVVFSCSLLHEATPVTAGRRYCTLPFLFDEAGEELRRRNQVYVDQYSDQGAVQGVRR